MCVHTTHSVAERTPKLLGCFLYQCNHLILDYIRPYMYMIYTLVIFTERTRHTALNDDLLNGDFDDYSPTHSLRTSPIPLNRPLKYSRYCIHVYRHVHFVDVTRAI